MLAIDPIRHSPAPPPSCCDGVWEALSTCGHIVVRTVRWIVYLPVTLYKVIKNAFEYLCLIFSVCAIVLETTRLRERLHLPPQGNGEDISAYFRRIWYHEGRPALTHPHIPPAHFSAPPALLQIAQPPETDVQALLTQFDEFVHADDEDLHLSDSDTPIDDFATLRAGMEAFISTNSASRWHNSEAILRLSHHLVHFLSLPDCDPMQRRHCLIELARAGHRGCPTRMHQSCMHYYRLFSGQFHFTAAAESVQELLHDLRLSILQQMARGDVHALGELLLSIGRQIGIRDVDAYNDDPRLMHDWRPTIALPRFLALYTREAVVNKIAQAMNGTPHPTRPWERRDVLLSHELVTTWFQQNPPPDVDLADFIFDTATNTVKQEAIEYMLIQMGVLIA